jgi:hypothetical protein
LDIDDSASFEAFQRVASRGVLMSPLARGDRLLHYQHQTLLDKPNTNNDGVEGGVEDETLKLVDGDESEDHDNNNNNAEPQQE